VIDMHRLLCVLVLVAASWSAAGAQPGDPRLREALLDLAKRDQAAMGGDPATRDAALQSHTEALRVLVADGWPTVTAVGADGAQAAWLVAQHADHDPAFQREVLGRMRELAAAGEVNLDNLAYLEDRVALGEKREQPYGTQGECRQGSWEPFPIAEPDKVDERRKAAELQPLADYVRFATRAMCGGGH
jgi:hypothetical protein